MILVNNQQNCSKAGTPINLKMPEINQQYLELVMKLPPRSPDLLGTETPKINTRIGPNLDFEEITLSRGNNSRNVCKPRQVIYRTTPRINRLSG